MSEPESTHEDPRKTRLIKYLLIAGTLAALPVYYITINAIARSDCARAKAEWSATDTAFKFGDKLTGSPAVPPGQNLLESGFFAEFRVLSGAKDAPMPTLEQWGEALRPATPGTLQFTGDKFDGAALFAPGKGRPALLVEAAGVSRAEQIRQHLERAIPDLAYLPALRRARPEITLGFAYPSLDNAMSGPMVSFKHARNAHALLITYAVASLRAGRVESGLSALDFALRYDALLTREPTLVHRMIGVVLTKQTLHAIHTALSLNTMPDAELARLDGHLVNLRCLIGLRHALAEEAMVWPAFLEKYGLGALRPFSGSSPGDVLVRLAELKTEDWQALSAYVVPEGWFIEDQALALRHCLKIQTEVITSDGRFSLQACNHLTELSVPDHPWWQISNATPAYRKPALNAAAADTAVRCARLAIALERHRLRHGGFPQALAALDADLWPDGKIPVGVVFGLPPEYTLTPTGGYSLVYRHEDAADAPPGKESTTARDVVWTIAPAPAMP